MAMPTPVVTKASDASCGVRLLIPAFHQPLSTFAIVRTG